MVFGQRHQPQRQLGQIDRHVVLVHAVQTSLSDQTAGVQHLVFIRWNVGRDGIVGVPRLDQFIAELTAGFHQKRPAAHRGIADFQVEDLGGMWRLFFGSGLCLLLAFLKLAEVS